MAIKSPYNFVSLNSKVVYPYWGNAISHDKPFENAVSGKFQLTLEARSPIFVRNGAAASEENNIAFNQMKNHFFIPATSIKGMLRSIVEIIGYGSMVNRVNEVKLSQRDWQNDQIYPKSEISAQALGGWLRKDGEEYKMKPCGKPGRISHKNLDVLVTDLIKNRAGAKMSTYYSSDLFRINDKTKSAQGKNETFPFQLTGHRFEKDPDTSEKFASEICKISESSDRKGTIVMTGQAGRRNNDTGNGKHLEFVFFDMASEEITVPKSVIENFKFAYYDHDPKSQKPDWKWRKKKLEAGEKIPVFYRMDGKEILDMGLTQLFKITYKHSVKELIENSQKPQLPRPDLADCIFGYINTAFEKNLNSLKGRVSIGHAWAEGSPKSLEKVSVVLSNPKASYYPNYLVQPKKMGPNDNYNTMNTLSEIRGYKRYPVRSTIKVPEYAANVGEQVKTHFQPLDKGTLFKTELAYHNLRFVELGAILSALTFHGSEDCFHRIGMAKSLGYGKVKIAISGIDESVKVRAIQEFEAWMELETESTWTNSKSIKELIAMAKENESLDEKLEYMALTDFSNEKANKQILMDILDLVKPNIPNLKTYCDPSLKKELIEKLNHDKSLYEMALGLQGVDMVKAQISEDKERLLKEFEDLKFRLRAKVNAMNEELNARNSELINMSDQLRKSAKSFDLSAVKMNAKAFEDLEKKMRGYSHLYKSAPMTGEDDINQLLAKLKEIVENLSSKDLNKWNEKDHAKNHIFKKIASWIGEEKTSKFFEQMINS